MHEGDGRDEARLCFRCGGRAFYWRTAVIPGDPYAPRGSNRAAPRYQPAWTCITCGNVEPHERRARPTDEGREPWPR